MVRSTGLKLLCGALLAAACVSANGAANDVAGSRDLEILPRFAGSKIVNFDEEAEQERIYPQGSIRRISGRLRYENSIEATGTRIALTYQLPSTHSSDEVFNKAREDVLKQGSELLYWCQGRDCGASSLWANSVFGESGLYGPDDQQAYALLKLAAPQDNQLVALYSITRGNRRAYLHAELFTANATLAEVLPTPATLMRQLRVTGTLELSAHEQPTEDWVTVVARALNLDSTMRVTLAGPQAEAWREALVEARVRAARLELDDDQVQGLRLNVLR
ncbi:MAG TPA: DUF4892 domain-containing protein [Pseudomonas sp.]|nr:DUF4892 domain-containing protein [Pseudomonas sp.]